ncbi:MAG: hypothetical protein R3D85_03920 [Paracoccaceae bacterium]
MGFQRVKAKLAVAGMIVALAAAPVAALAESLADAMASAYEHNGLVDQNRALLRAADEDVAQAVSGLRPIVGWAADLTHSWGRAGSYSTNPITGVTSFRSGDSATTDISLGISAELLL